MENESIFQMTIDILCLVDTKPLVNFHLLVLLVVVGMFSKSVVSMRFAVY